MESLPTHPKLYEINSRVWRRRFDKPLQRATLDHIPQDVWGALAEKGIHIVWLMGVWRTNRSCVEKYNFQPDLIAAYKRALPDWSKEDVIGSPFSIDEYALDPGLGSPESLSRLRQKLHQYGIRVMLDFVPNHFSADSHLIRLHPEIFLQGNEELWRLDPQTFFEPDGVDQVFAHGRDPYFPAWTDTIQVNYFRPDARYFMIQRLLEVAEVCDGVRCDMAMLMLNDIFRTTWGRVLNELDLVIPEDEFWPQAISEVKSRFPEFIFMAEAYWGEEWRLQRQGFDFTYDKTLRDHIRDNTVDAIHKHLVVTSDYQPRAVHFLENHDEERAVAAFGKAKSLAGAVIISTLPGVRFYYDGQFEGRCIRLPLQLGREPTEPVQKDVQAFYERLLAMTKEPVFFSGDWQLLIATPVEEDPASHKNLLAWLWRYGSERRLVVVNITDKISRCRLKFDVTDCKEQIEFIDLLTMQAYRRFRREVQEMGLDIELGHYQAHILTF